MGLFKRVTDIISANLGEMAAMRSSILPGSGRPASPTAVSKRICPPGVRAQTSVRPATAAEPSSSCCPLLALAARCSLDARSRGSPSVHV